ncbi:hypothetical protein BY996DRAFT_6599447 [Phakopsora pachyrhizi]|nr:hypothetical protein BY996DRAFT_6599447 [Phakopsora pachyrhizi]
MVINGISLTIVRLALDRRKYDSLKAAVYCLTDRRPKNVTKASAAATGGATVEGSALVAGAAAGADSVALVFADLEGARKTIIDVNWKWELGLCLLETLHQDQYRVSDQTQMTSFLWGRSALKVDDEVLDKELQQVRLYDNRWAISVKL